MAAIALRLKAAGPHIINDLGITIVGSIGTKYDLSTESAKDVSWSEDMVAAINNGLFVVLDPRDTNEVIELSVAESIHVLRYHNQIHWGVVGGRLNRLDDPNVTLSVNDLVVVDQDQNISTVTFTTLLGTTVISAAVRDFVGGMFDSSPNITYDNVTGNITLDDNFLRKDGGTLTTGTLQISSGTSIVIENGADLTIQGQPVLGTSAVNKNYVDSFVQGLDHKRSVIAATTDDLGFTFGDNGGAGDTLTSPINGSTTIDGIALSIDNRILVKDQTTATQNGIYSVTGSDPTVLTRATDSDGTADSEVSSGNTTFVEQGNINNATGWVLTGTGNINVGTDDIIWTQNTGVGTHTVGNGLELTGNQFSLQSGLGIRSVNGQPVLTFADQSRNDKILSVETVNLLWAEGNATPNDWMQIAGANDADSCYIVPMNATIVMSTAHCENVTTATSIGLFVNASASENLNVGALPMGENVQFTNTTLDFDVNQGDRLRLRNTTGIIDDVVVTLFIKWRA